MHGSEYTNFFFLSKGINKLSLRICRGMANFKNIESYQESKEAIVRTHCQVFELVFV